MRTSLCKAILLLLLLPVSSLVLAQSLTEKAQSVSINILGLEYAYEHTLGTQTTLTWHGGLAGELGYSYTRLFSYEHEEWKYSIRGTAGADLRYYYNLRKRAEKGKSIRRNSADFLSVDLTYYTPPMASKNIDGQNVVNLTPAWGIRRVYGNNLFFELKLGALIGVQGSEWAAGLCGNIKFGYTF